MKKLRAKLPKPPRVMKKAAEEAANAAPIVKFVNLVLFQAIQDRASDIHFEPFETEFRIRYPRGRCMLYRNVAAPETFGAACHLPY